MRKISKLQIAYYIYTLVQKSISYVKNRRFVSVQYVPILQESFEIEIIRAVPVLVIAIKPMDIEELDFVYRVRLEAVCA